MSLRKIDHQPFTRGGQIAFHHLRMLFQIHKALFNVYMVCFIAILSFFVYLLIPYEDFIRFILYEKACLFKWVGVHAYAYAPFPETIIQLKECLQMALGISISMVLLLSWYFVHKGSSQMQHYRVRGSQLAPSYQVKQAIKRNKEASNLKIDGFPLIKNSEMQHLLIHGTVGTGKSQLIMKIMDCIQKRGDRAIVYDKGCVLIPHYFNSDRDVILNPYDTRCASWDLWREAPTSSHLENMAESLLPMQGDADPFWVNAARIVFVAAASKMREEADRSLERLLTILIKSPFEDLESYVQGTAAASLISSKIEKTSISIRSVVTTSLKSMQSLSNIEGLPFSIREYLLDEKKKGWIFISSNGEQHKELKPLMSMWLAMASLTMLSLAPDAKRRVWFICDELPSLHKLPLLGETIAEVRKFGGCFLLGMQSVAQLEKVYGKSGAQEIFDLLNTRFFFRSPSSDIARIVSRELGEEDMDESKENYSYGVRDGLSVGHQRVVRPIVAYPEILELPNLSCYLRLPGGYPITKLSLKHQHRKILSEGLMLKPESLNLSPLMTSSIEKVLMREPRIHDYLE